MSQIIVLFLLFICFEIDEEIIQGVVEVLCLGWIIIGLQCQKFEVVLFEYCGGCLVCVFNLGICMFEIGLCIVGVGFGDEVIMMLVLWVLISNVIIEMGVMFVFVDIDFVMCNIDFDKFEQVIMLCMKVIIFVFLFGLLVDMDCLYVIVCVYKLCVIEDVVQVFGLMWYGRCIGVIGDFVLFSFYVNKNLMMIEGGVFVLNNEDEVVFVQKYWLQGIMCIGFDGMDCDVFGGKYNLIDVVVCVGFGQLLYFECFIVQCCVFVCVYFVVFDGGVVVKFGVGLFVVEFENGNWYMFLVMLLFEWLMIMCVEFMVQMKECGIGMGIYYLVIYFFMLYCVCGFKEGMFFYVEWYGVLIVMLLLFMQMMEGDVCCVVDVVNQICE